MHVRSFSCYIELKRNCYDIWVYQNWFLNFQFFLFFFTNKYFAFGVLHQFLIVLIKSCLVFLYLKCPKTTEMSFQKTIWKHHRRSHTVKSGKPLRLSTHHHKTAFIFTFHLNILMFRWQYEWTPKRILFCRHRILQLFCLNVEAGHAIRFSQK